MGLPIRTEQPRHDELDPALVRALFDFDQEAGVLTWRVSPGMSIQVGSIAGFPRKEYGGRQVWTIRVNGRQYPRARLAWVHYHAQDPAGWVVHHDGNDLNDRPANLRLSTVKPTRSPTHARTHMEDGEERALPKGVGPLMRKGVLRYRALYREEGRRIDLGHFSTPELAAAAIDRRKAGVRLEHPRTGKTGPKDPQA